jgi:hypothetical protein
MKLRSNTFQRLPIIRVRFFGIALRRGRNKLLTGEQDLKSETISLRRFHLHLTPKQVYPAFDAFQPQAGAEGRHFLPVHSLTVVAVLKPDLPFQQSRESNFNLGGRCVF